MAIETRRVEELCQYQKVLNFYDILFKLAGELYHVKRRL